MLVGLEVGVLVGVGVDVYVGVGVGVRVLAGAAVAVLVAGGVIVGVGVDVSKQAVRKAAETMHTIAYTEAMRPIRIDSQSVLV